MLAANDALNNKIPLTLRKEQSILDTTYVYNPLPKEPNFSIKIKKVFLSSESNN